jgi:Tfp pilus assembly protein PilF
MAFKREKVLAAAQKYASKGQHEKAAKEFQAVVDNDPSDLRIWLMLADSLARAGKSQEASDKYFRAAKAYHEQKEFSKALAVYRQVLGVDPKRIDVHLKCADLHAELRQIPDAVGTYERVGKVYLKQGRTDDAITLFQKVVELDPANVTRRLRLAELYSREKMNEEAVETFRAAGQVLFDERKYDDYIRVAERLLYHAPNDRDSSLKIVNAYLRQQQPRRALMKLNSLLQDQPSDREGLELLCETFVRLGKVDKAVSVVLEIVREHTSGSEESQASARRVLERGLGWAPQNEELKKAWKRSRNSTRSTRSTRSMRSRKSRRSKNSTSSRSSTSSILPRNPETQRPSPSMRSTRRRRTNLRTPSLRRSVSRI